MKPHKIPYMQQNRNRLANHLDPSVLRRPSWQQFCRPCVNPWILGWVLGWSNPPGWQVWGEPEDVLGFIWISGMFLCASGGFFEGPSSFWLLNPLRHPGDGPASAIVYYHHFTQTCWAMAFQWENPSQALGTENGGSSWQLDIAGSTGHRRSI